jgi:succinate dehydrogenase / fumarate reductase, membrane anchor subunit
MRMETPLAKVRGLGAAGHGGSDWWAMRLSSVALLLLSVWLLVSLLRLPSLQYSVVLEWLGDPLAAVPMLLFIVVGFWHIKKGLREIIDDYAHSESGKVLWITLLAFFVYGGGALAAFCVLKIALGGGAA